MLIERANIQKDCLKGKTVLITGAGGGIGFEAAKALAWMGANVVIAEIDKVKGQKAEKAINEQLNKSAALFYHIDLSDELQIDKLHSFIIDQYGFVDIVFNNATIAPLGAVDDVKISEWDKSYAVNLRAPVLLTQKFLPDMKEKGRGTIVFVPSSGAAPYMGAYEVFKTAQVELCNTLAGELENSGIYVYAIGPGLVKTETAQRAIEKVASLMNLTTGDFYAMNQRHLLDIEYAGVGFALSTAFSQKYSGQEISSIQVLIDTGIMEQEQEQPTKDASHFDAISLDLQIKKVIRTYDEQYNGWLQRNVFERQWVFRDFKKEVKLSAEQFMHEINNMQALIEQGDFVSLGQKKSLFTSLQGYYRHQHKLMLGYEKDPKKRDENTQIILGWIEELQAIIDKLQ